MIGKLLGTAIAAAVIYHVAKEAIKAARRRDREWAAFEAAFDAYLANGRPDLAGALKRGQESRKKGGVAWN